MTTVNCPCDDFVHPAPLSIDAGLSVLPRQIATFATFRHAMLRALPTQPALAEWRARGDQDLGVMLLEMWAYVCDVVAFYDETIAHESYLRTARLTPSVRKLVALLGYRPRPAVAARARLAVAAGGRLPLVLPAGTAFRSSSFGSEPPQVFELDADTRVHPLLNGWSLAPVRPATIAAGTTQLWLAPDSAKVQRGDRLLLLTTGESSPPVFTAQAVTAITGSDGHKYKQVALSAAIPSARPVATTRLLRPTASVAIWSNPSDTTTPLTATATSIVLSTVVPQIKANTWVIATGPLGASALLVTSALQSTRRLAAGTSYGSGSSAVTSPVISVSVTVLTVSPHWPASVGTDAAQSSIEYNLQDAGILTMPVKPRIAPGDPLHLVPPIEAPPDGSQPGAFLIADADGSSLELSGGVDFTARTLNPAQGSGFGAPLDPPATVYANVAAVTRGETVPSEVLGTGDGSIANQTFKLKKKPLTYISAPTGADASGVQSTLTIWVRDIAWREVPSLFGVAPDAQIYVVRQDDDGESWVTFGDGVRGARLPTGASVVARYRFGGGAASPPAGGIIQLARPVKGLTAVRNPVPAAGGADREPASQVRVYAPRSALLFGRAVSIKDMEALAAGQPGVQAVQAQWAWDAQMQQPGVQIWYIGPAGIAAALTQSLRSATAPSTPITASPAAAIPATLVVDLRVDRRYQIALVQAAVIARLTAAGTGLLSPEQIGIGAPLFRSRILAEALAVEGASTLGGLLWQGTWFTEFGVTPGDGAWFQVSLTVNATEDQDG
jgi:hypothetical protein